MHLAVEIASPLRRCTGWSFGHARVADKFVGLGSSALQDSSKKRNVAAGENWAPQREGPAVATWLKEACCVAIGGTKRSGTKIGATKGTKGEMASAFLATNKKYTFSMVWSRTHEKTLAAAAVLFLIVARLWNASILGWVLIVTTLQTITHIRFWGTHHLIMMTEV